MSNRLRIQRGLKILEGGRGPFGLKTLFGQGNYQKIDSSYRGKFIQTRQRKNGTRYLWHTGLEKEVTDKDIQQAIFEDFTGTKTPYKDRRYLDEKAAIKRAEELGKNFKWYDTTVGELGHKLRIKLGNPIYDTKGKLLGTEYELNRQKKINERKDNLEDLKNKSSYRTAVHGSTLTNVGGDYNELNIGSPSAHVEKDQLTINKNSNKPVGKLQITPTIDYTKLRNVGEGK